MRKEHQADDFECPVGATVAVMGGKWKASILHVLLEPAGVSRFGELRRRLPAATPQMLTNQLRELEADGVVHRRVYRQVPPKVEYSLTPLGRTLEPVVRAMCEWGRGHERRLRARDRRRVTAARGARGGRPTPVRPPP